ncbi:tetraprenyl-beta-curcumene synthase [Salsuginibacillus halophilus]|uniref:Tetraprenyl-beta-curcumene synthase n=1 Tax=Salsuginibacillus halophilus TaxID=517424 RepID=A0A2P8HE48_9BACI|nr:tetraprenyl-beta-curcumene synthase family protein [Salsuginibacillus halophilus]PSL44498.1 tetraprenyl-beta-curcumene synthase [Salsuginibacillus halophilus]
MGVPTRSWTVLYRMYRQIIPMVHKELKVWREHAKTIPNDTFREQALLGVYEKSFHCEGGGAYAMLSNRNQAAAVKFIVAYQTICDYLDNLCDKSDAQDPDDFRAMHEALQQALDPEAERTDYYRYREEKDDNGYLHALVDACREAAQAMPGFSSAQPAMEELSAYYRDLQVYKHVKEEDRLPLLKAWFERHEPFLPSMYWFEFAAATGSTMGLYSLAGYAAGDEISEETAQQVKNGYFPWVQGLHILLDYFIDQEEDRQDGELNFCFYYESEDEMVARFRFFKAQAEASLRELPHPAFHERLNHGMMALYLADEKVQTQKDVKQTAKRFLKLGGAPTLFFYLNSWVFRRKTKRDPAS